MRVGVVGGGPGGLRLAALLRKADTFGSGVPERLEIVARPATTQVDEKALRADVVARTGERS